MNTARRVSAKYGSFVAASREGERDGNRTVVKVPKDQSRSWAVRSSNKK